MRTNLIVLVLLAVACGGSAVPDGKPDAATTNTQDGGDAGPGSDAGPDGGTVSDAGPDAGEDAGEDAGTDAGSDAGTAADAGSPTACTIADCQGGVAYTCSGDQLSLVCSTFGAACQSFTDTSGNAFKWCTCGNVTTSRCLSDSLGVICDNGVGTPGTCVAGTKCAADPGSPDGIGCFCDNVADGICPDPSCTDDVDCNACTPNCNGVTCGPNGCGGNCGTCGIGQTCQNGACAATCSPSCGSHQCGDDGCGGSCGTCPSGTACSSGQCNSTCVPQCSGKQCGQDGCGGFCGTCPGTETCTTGGTCAQGACTPSCSGKICGFDGCSGLCGSCANDDDCSTDGTSCVCGSFSTRSFTFDGSALDYNALFGVHVTIQLSSVTSGSSRDDFLLQAGTASTYSVRFRTCSTTFTIQRTYYLKNGAGQCDSTTQTITGTNIVIPAPAISNGSCTAGPMP